MGRRLTRARAITALALVFATLVLAAPGPRHADAALQTQQSCGSTGSTPIAVGNQFECDYVTTVDILGSSTSPATLHLMITSPASGTFFFGPGVISALPNNCTAAAPPPPPAPPSADLFISCPPTSATSAAAGGIKAGTVVPLQLISGYPFGTAPVSPVPGQITMSATYTAPSGTTSTISPINFVYQFDAFPGPATPPPPPNATITDATGTAAPTGVTCTNTTAGARFGSTTSFQLGDTIQCDITYQPGQTQSFVVVAGNGVVTANPGPQQSSRLSPNNLGFPCGVILPTRTACGGSPTASNVPPVAVRITGTMAATGTPSFTVRSFALGAAQPYNTATVSPAGVTVVPPPSGGGGGGGGGTSGSGINSAIGCANSTLASDIAFPATPVPGNNQQGFLASATQFSSRPPLSGTATAPGALSVLSPNVAIICGAVFQDSGTSAGGDSDANPNTIDGGSIVYTVSSPAVEIVESSGTTYTVFCGTTALPGGKDSCKSAVFTPAFNASSAPPLQANPASPAFISPPEANIVHVVLAPGASFPFVGALSPTVTISATYTRAASLGGDLTTTTPAAPITLLPPPYQLQLAANPGTIAAASGVDNGSTIVATVVHPVVTGCVTLQIGNFLVCPAVQSFFLPSVSPGAEGGQITFTTDAGALGPASASSGSQLALRYTVHCGPIPSAPPVVIVPDVPSLNPAPASFVFASCTAVQVTLYGAGAPGTATVTASFIGDITGVTAQATTQVTLAAAGAAANLSPGCNQVITPASLSAGSPLSAVVNVVQPGGIVVSIWQFNNSTHRFQAGYFATSNAPLDFTTVGPGQSLWVCVNNSGSYQPGSPSSGNGPTGP